MFKGAVTQIFVDSKNIQDTKVPVDDVHTEHDSPSGHGAGFQPETEPYEVEYNGRRIAWVPHVPYPDRKLVTEMSEHTSLTRMCTYNYYLFYYFAIIYWQQLIFKPLL